MFPLNAAVIMLLVLAPNASNSRAQQLLGDEKPLALQGERMVEWREQRRLDLGSSPVLATTIGRFSTRHEESQQTDNSDANCGTAPAKQIRSARFVEVAWLLYDADTQTRYSFGESFDHEASTRAAFLRIDRPTSPSLYVRSTRLGDLYVWNKAMGQGEPALTPDEASEFSKIAWSVELNGMTWQYGIADYLKGAFIPDQELAARNITTAESVTQALGRLGKLLSHAGLPHSDFPICSAEMPGFVRTACKGLDDQQIECPRWVPTSEDTCELDATFGFPCVREIVERTLTEFELAWLGITPHAAPPGHSLDEGCLPPLKPATPRPQVDADLVQELYDHGLRVDRAAVGTRPEYLYLQVRIGSEEDAPSAVHAVAAALKMAHLKLIIQTLVPAAVELDVVLNSGRYAGRYRISLDQALQLLRGEISAQQLIIGRCLADAEEEQH